MLCILLLFFFPIATAIAAVAVILSDYSAYLFFSVAVRYSVAGSSSVQLNWEEGEEE